MIRRIVLLRSYEWLSEGWRRRSFAPAAVDLERRIRVRGVEFPATFHPVRAFTRYGPPTAARVIKYGARTGRGGSPYDGYAVVGMFDGQEDVERLRRDRRDHVLGVFADPRIEACPMSYCGSAAVGDFNDVRRALGFARLRREGIEGRGVRIAIVDTGISGAHPGPDGRPLRTSLDTTRTFPRGYRPGTAALDHGTMVAFDSLIGAPGAKLLDYALLQSTTDSWSSFLSDALAAFADLIELLRSRPGPLVVTNSWGLFDSADDAPIGSPENYSANPEHPFNQIVGALVSAGADVLFAAGNCGADCPDGRCGARDVGPGNSIHGANSHPSVITVAAVTVKKVRLGYSSQGPGALADRKPDIGGYSHFVGSGVYQADAGTSAASPVAAGVVAALRQAWRTMPPAELKGVIQRSADPVEGGWSYDLGYGVVNAERALAEKAVRAKRRARRARTPRKPRAPRAAWMLVRSTPEELERHVARLCRPRG